MTMKYACNSVPPGAVADNQVSALRAALGQSRMPLYLQAASILRARLEIGEWRIGDRLPSIEQLADEIHIARMTLRQAIECLEMEGILECRQGHGTYVKRDILPQRRYRVATDWASLVKGIVEGAQKMLPAGEHPARPVLELGEAKLADTYRFMKRLNLKDGVPYGFMSYYIATRVFDMNPEAFLKGPVLPVLAELEDIGIERATQTMAISTAGVESANTLGVPLGSPVVLARRLFVDDAGVAIFVCEITYRGDHIRFEVDLLPGSPFEKKQNAADRRRVVRPFAGTKRRPKS